ncbi:MAG: hypothetical protein MI810_22685, partial [Flavobacteriales bacterium]|nr:hypothetical protein [Flavobacteriales bacterium]
YYDVNFGLASGPLLKLSFTVKEQVVTSFNDTTNLGEITVNAPAGNLPYKYLISLDGPLPSLDTIWTAIKDSIPVDSSTFYHGDFQTQNFTFSNLPPERYYIGVYDNSGTKIQDVETIIGPEVSLVDVNQLEITNQRLQVQNSFQNGSAVINGIIYKYADGGFEFEVDELGDFVIGFNNLNDARASLTSDFEFGFEVHSNGLLEAFNHDSIIFRDTIAVGEKLRLSKNAKSISYYYEDRLLEKVPIYSEYDFDYRIDVLFKSSIGATVGMVKLDDFAKPFRPIKTIVDGTECEQDNGSISIVPITWTYISGGAGSGTYNIIDLNTGLSVASGPVTTTSFSVPLPIGEYKVEYSWSNGTVSLNWFDLVDIGQAIYWNLWDEYFTAVGGTVNTITTNNYSEIAQALSQNMLLSGEEGWSTHNVGIKKYVPKYGAPSLFAGALYAKISWVDEDNETVLTLNVHNLGGGILNKYYWVSDDAGDMVGTLSNTYLNGIYKIELDDSDFEVSFNGDSPFAVMAEPTPSDYQVHAKAFNAYIHDSYASFCHGLTNSTDCGHLDYELDGNYYVTNNGKFCFVYNEEYNDPNIEFNIYNQTHTLVATQDDYDLPALIMGENRVILDLTSTGHCIGQGFFVLEVINDKKEKFYLRFYSDYSLCSTPSTSGGGSSF